MEKPKPPCITIVPWLRANLGKHCAAGLTGTDARALSAAVQCIELYSVTCDGAALHAFNCCVRLMQPSMRELAYHSIAHVMDWGHRPELWAKAELDPIPNPRRCQFEH